MEARGEDKGVERGSPRERMEILKDHIAVIEEFLGRGNYRWEDSSELLRERYRAAGAAGDNVAFKAVCREMQQEAYQMMLARDADVNEPRNGR